MVRELVPVACPACGELQNILPGGFDPDKEPFGPVVCMVCRRPFSRAEYMNGLAERLQELQVLSGPAVG